MGCKLLSVAPGSLPAVKSVIRSIETESAWRIARKCLKLKSAEKIEEYLADELAKLSTGLFVENVKFGRR